MTADKRKETDSGESILTLYENFSWKEALMGFFLFLIPVVIIWKIFGTPSNKFMVIHPRELISLPAIFLSNFSHGSAKHLVGNMAAFFFLGIWVMKTEGVRGFIGILIGMTFAGAAIWLLGKGPTLGFSGAVFACIGILIVRTLRKNLWQFLFLVIILGTVFETSFFETIRPTKYAIGKHISWLGHLGGLIGGMIAQIRDQSIALQMLFEDGNITKAEFIEISERIFRDKKNSEHNEEEISQDDEENISNTHESEHDSNTKETPP